MRPGIYVRKSTAQDDVPEDAKSVVTKTRGVAHSSPSKDGCSSAPKSTWMRPCPGRCSTDPGCGV